MKGGQESGISCTPPLHSAWQACCVNKGVAYVHLRLDLFRLMCNVMTDGDFLLIMLATVIALSVGYLHIYSLIIKNWRSPAPLLVWSFLWFFDDFQDKK